MSIKDAQRYGVDLLPRLEYDRTGEGDAFVAGLVRLRVDPGLAVVVLVREDLGRDRAGKRGANGRRAISVVAAEDALG